MNNIDFTELSHHIIAQERMIQEIVSTDHDNRLIQAILYGTVDLLMRYDYSEKMILQLTDNMQKLSGIKIVFVMEGMMM